MIGQVPVTLSFEVSEHTDDFSAILTHDILPGLRVIFSAADWAEFCGIDWETATQHVLAKHGRTFKREDWERDGI
jgi:hypothetical protein